MTEGHTQPSRLWQHLSWSILVALAAPEIMLQLTDAGLAGSLRWRQTAYGYGALWPGLVTDGWRPNYAAQPALMFATHAFLHGGLIHLLGNILPLWWLASKSGRVVGASGLALLYIISILGGALTFVLLAPGTRPMVGVSSAVYGLAVAWIYWEYRSAANRRKKTAIALCGLVCVNALSLWLTGGEMAWQAHMGGMVAGGLCAWWLDPDRRRGQISPFL